MPEESTYLPRLVDGSLATLLSFAPAILVTGPRGSGKTTAALRHTNQVVRLDRPREAIAYRADPGRGPEQHRVPGAICDG